jgi:D-amino peptidase
VLDHTWNESILNVWLNETLVGEFGLNGALAGHFGVPVISVTGDQTACAQTADLFGDLERVVVKHASGRLSALCLPLEASQAAVREGAARALTRLKNGNVPRPWAPSAPIRVTVEFRKSDQGDRAMRYPGSQRDGNRVASRPQICPPPTSHSLPPQWARPDDGIYPLPTLPPGDFPKTTNIHKSLINTTSYCILEMTGPFLLCDPAYRVWRRAHSLLIHCA